MTLYHTDSKGTKVVIAEHIKDPMEAMTYLVRASSTRFIVPKGRLSISVDSKANFHFVGPDGNESGYTLEQ